MFEKLKNNKITIILIIIALIYAYFFAASSTGEVIGIHDPNCVIRDADEDTAFKYKKRGISYVIRYKIDGEEYTDNTQCAKKQYKIGDRIRISYSKLTKKLL